MIAGTVCYHLKRGLAFGRAGGQDQRVSITILTVAGGGTAVGGRGGQ